LWCIVGEEEVKVCLCVRVAILEDAHLVARVCGVVGFGNVVDISDTSWCNYVVTVAEIGGGVDLKEDEKLEAQSWSFAEGIKGYGTQTV